MQNSSRGNEFNKFSPPNSSDDLCLLFCKNPSSMPHWLLFSRLISKPVSILLSCHAVSEMDLTRRQREARRKDIKDKVSATTYFRLVLQTSCLLLVSATTFLPTSGKGYNLPTYFWLLLPPSYLLPVSATTFLPTSG